MLVRSVRARRATRIRSYYATHCTLKTQTMAVACPWILGSRLSIILSTQAASLGECEPVRMLSVALGVDPDISHAVVKDCHVQTKSMFNQAGSSSRRRSAFLSLASLQLVRQGGSTLLRARWPLRRRPHATTTHFTHTSRADDVIVWIQKALQRAANERADHIIAR